MSRPIRIVSYNILDGGVGRADPIAEVLLAQRPDVVGLVEADDPDMIARVAWRLGFDCVAAEGRNGRTAALLTRGRILQSTNLVPLLDGDRPRSFLLATVELDGRDLDVAVIHLTSKASDEHEARREREIETILKATEPLRSAGRPHVLMGDFNAVSPTWRVEPDALPDKVRPHYEANGNAIPRRAIRAMLDAGYVDAHAADATPTFTTAQPGLRLDYIFAHGCAASSAWVETDRLADFASDHRPVGAELA